MFCVLFEQFFKDSWLNHQDGRRLRASNAEHRHHAGCIMAELVTWTWVLWVLTGELIAQSHLVWMSQEIANMC